MGLKSWGGLVKKYIWSMLCFVVCIGVLVGCASPDKTGTVSAGNTQSVAQTSSQDTLSEEAVTESEATSSVESSLVQDTSSKVTSSKKPSVPTVDDGDPKNRYPVNDPNNQRGLSTTRYGYSYGVAQNGKPHSQSVNNQKTFDAMKNVEALAIDTVSTDKRMYLTFDCGYEYKNITADILDILKEKNVKAAFFLTLNYIKKNPILVRRMIDEGHIVGNHSATHPVFTSLSRNKMSEEIYLVDKYLKENFNYSSDYFRPPSGDYSENSLELTTSVGKKSIFWSVAYADWDTESQKGADYAYNTVTARYHPGAVILLHAVSSDNRDALARMIDKACSDGYTFKTLDDYYAK